MLHDVLYGVHALITVALAIYTIILSIRRADRDETQSGLEKLGNRVADLEKKHGVLVDRPELEALRERIVQLLGVPKDFVDRHEFNGLKGRVEGISRSLTAVESDIRHLPTANQVTQILSDLARAVTGITHLNDRFDRIEHRFELYEEAALKGKA